MLILFFIFSLLIFLSTIGYGFILVRFLKFEKFEYNYGLTGILGLFCLSIISSYTHLFYPHNYTHNVIIIFLGLLGLILFNKKFLKKIKYILVIFFLLFISIIMSKTNEDFGYYHLPNSLQFAQQKLQFGLGNLNHGFKHISSLFNIMSLNYLPIFKFYLFNLPNLLFLTFLVIFLITEIYFRFKINLNLSNIILSLILVLFLVKFARLAEYGSDLSGQIVIAIYFFYLLELFFNKKIKKEEKTNYLKISIIMIVFAITLKFISVIYSVLYLMLLYFVQNKRYLFLSLIKFNFLILIILSLSIFIFFNFSSTGCLVYPVEMTCFSEKFDWALSHKVVKYLNFHYELWSKGGLGPNFSIDNQEEYIVFLNWLPNWFSVYFIGKFSDYVLVLISLILIFSIFYIKDIFFSKIKNNNDNLNFNVFFYLLLLLIFLLWFYNFPTLRYSGYIIVFLLVILPYSIFISKRINFSKKNNIKKLSLIFLISYSIFFTKNIIRINSELNLSEINHHNFKNFPFFWIDKKEYNEILINNHKLNLTKGSCWAVPSTCIKETSNLKIIKKNDYIFYINEKK